MRGAALLLDKSMSNYRRIEVGERVSWPDQFKPRAPAGQVWCKDDGWLPMEKDSTFILPQCAFNEYRRCVDVPLDRRVDDCFTARLIDPRTNPYIR